VIDEVTNNDDLIGRFVRQRFKNMEKMGIGTIIMCT
jgi:high-affinity K+ transport system ATPase subunit B